MRRNTKRYSLFTLLALDAQQTLAPEAEGGQTLELVEPEFANPSHEIKKERHFFQEKSGGI